jgi:Ca-activated chloride channel homolog
MLLKPYRNANVVYGTLKFLLPFILYSLLPPVVIAQTKKETKPPITNILFLFDGSGSMNAKWQTAPKIDVAKRLMRELLDSLRYIPNVQLALRVYGHQKPFPPQDCDDTKLEVPFGKGNISTIQDVIMKLSPKGTTPIAKSLELCANDFPQAQGRNIIILITDGIEECGGDPCAATVALQKKGIFLKPFVIGLGLDESLKKNFDCVGRFYDATNEVMFKQALNVVISQALNPTTMQVNLLDQAHNPTETNVNMTFYDQHTGAIRYNFIHTLNSKGMPDTLIVDPLSTYRIVVHTIPEVSKESVALTPGKHTTVGIDAPQGYLALSTKGLIEYKKLQAIVRKHYEMQTLNTQSFNSTEKYLVGKYDLEILTLPRTYVENVDISQSKTTTLEVAQPGIVSFIYTGPGYGSIYLEDKGSLHWIYNLDAAVYKETVVLQPGKYKAVFRPKAAKESIYTVTKSFEVISGTSVAVQMNP